MNLKRCVTRLLPPVITDALCAAKRRIWPTAREEEIPPTGPDDQIPATAPDDQIPPAPPEDQIPPTPPGDEPITFELNGCLLRMPRSHSLPWILEYSPQYEGEIGRVAAFLLAKQGRLSIIDVGANIGDTVASIPCRERATFLCIEGSVNYFSLLRQNFTGAPNVICVNAILSDSADLVAPRALAEVNGTAHVVEALTASSAADPPTRTLDAVLADHPDFPAPNFLKVDTDGYDLKVLCGADGLLRANRPAIHFELSFRHWKDFGRSSWRQAAELLNGAGYRDFLLYDTQGYLAGVDAFQSSALLSALEGYCFRRPRPLYIWFNVVTFHESDPHWEEFKASELGRTLD